MTRCVIDGRFGVLESCALREKIADVQHAIWAHWMRYLFSCCIENDDGSATIPADKVSRWLGQKARTYDQLSEKEKDSDREQADKVLKVL